MGWRLGYNFFFYRRCLRVCRVKIRHGSSSTPGGHARETISGDCGGRIYCDREENNAGLKKGPEGETTPVRRTGGGDWSMREDGLEGAFSDSGGETYLVGGEMVQSFSASSYVE